MGGNSREFNFDFAPLFDFRTILFFVNLQTMAIASILLHVWMVVVTKYLIGRIDGIINIHWRWRYVISY